LPNVRQSSTVVRDLRRYRQLLREHPLLGGVYGVDVEDEIGRLEYLVFEFNREV
jgi:hypothetical protein